MKAFAIPESTNVTVVSVNPRREKHGKVKVPAVDVRCSFVVQSEFLDQLKPELRAALWRLRGAKDAGDGKLGLDDVVVAVPGMAPVHLEDELTGYTVTFDLGTGRKESVVELSDAKVNAFVVEPHDGGPAKVDFRLQAARLGKREFGELCLLVDSLVAIRLAPPEPDTAQKTIDEAEKELDEPPKKPRSVSARAAAAKKKPRVRR